MRRRRLTDWTSPSHLAVDHHHHHITHRSRRWGSLTMFFANFNCMWRKRRWCVPGPMCVCIFCLYVLPPHTDQPLSWSLLNKSENWVKTKARRRLLKSLPSFRPDHHANQTHTLTLLAIRTSWRLASELASFSRSHSIEFNVCTKAIIIPICFSTNRDKLRLLLTGRARGVKILFV